MIGLSLSFCIKDILDGKVKEQDVSVVYAATAARTFPEFVVVCRFYVSMYWSNQFAGYLMAIRMWRAGKIRQPRLLERRVPSVAKGHWVDDYEEIEWIDC